MSILITLDRSFALLADKMNLQASLHIACNQCEYCVKRNFFPGMAEALRGEARNSIRGEKLMIDTTRHIS